MPKYVSRLALPALALALLVPSVTCVSVAAPLDPALSTEANLVRLQASILASSQFSHHPLDRELASRFLDRYLDSMDERRSLFLQSDVKAFVASRPQLSQAITDNGDTSLAQVVRKRYLERLEQRQAFVRARLAGPPLSFDSDETYQLDRHEAARPADLDAAQRLWELQLRSEYLDEKLDGVEPAQIVEKLARRYEQQLLTERSLRLQDVMSMYLNALATVYDPHSQYLDREQLQSFENSMKLSLSGIGASLHKSEGYCTIAEILPGSPASQSVLKPGDRILSVAQAEGPPVEITNLPLTRAVELIRGPRGSRVTLKIAPADGAGTNDITLVRAEVQLEDEQAKAYVIDLPSEGGTLRLGVIDLPSFYAPMGSPGMRGSRVTADVRRLLGRLKAENVRGILLDLRKNGGGSLDEAIALTGLFIPSGPVVQTRDPAGDISVKPDPDPREVYDGPLIVLTSRMSASASEILAGALQDYGRALVVGDSSTFGKGTVQSVVPLAKIMKENGLRYSFDPGALKITVGKFYRPSGASTQLRGVRADIVIPSTTDLEEIGESDLQNPLPWDVVEPSSYARKRQVEPYTALLRDQSRARIAAQPVFEQLQQGLGEARARLSANRVSLNEAVRRQELARAEERQRALVSWWKARHDTAPPSYEIRLKDKAAHGLPAAKPFAVLDDAEAQRAARAGAASAGAALASGAADDVVLDEAVHILADYVRLARSKSRAA